MIMLKKEKPVLPVSAIIQQQQRGWNPSGYASIDMTGDRSASDVGKTALPYLNAHASGMIRSGALAEDTDWRRQLTLLGGVDVGMSSVGRQSPISVGSDAPTILSPASNSSFVSANGGPASPGISPPQFTIGSGGSSFINTPSSGGTTSNGNGTVSTSPTQYPPNHPLSGSKHLCSICGDKASGKHYGVYSCEGCKGFFKRTVRKELVYSCRENKNCVIDKRQRNRCQYCRHKKCLTMGMKREAVQEERQRTKEKNEMSEANQANGSVSDMPLSRIREAEMLADPQDIQIFDDQKPDIAKYCQAAKEQMEQVVRWAKHIPHFSSLPLKDQMILLKVGWNELLIAAFSHRSIGVEDAIVLANGVRVDRSTMQDYGLDGIFDRVLSELVAKMREMRMDKAEIGCLRAIVLYNPDAKGLSAVNEVEVLREKVYAALEEYTKTNYIHEPGRFPKLLLRLPALRSIGLKCTEHLFFLKDWGGNYPKLLDTPIDKYLLNLLDDRLQTGNVSSS